MGHQAGEIRWEGDHPRALHDQDPHEARDEGWQARDVRQGRGGQSQARKDNCQGILRGSPQEEHLSRDVQQRAPACLTALGGESAGAALEGCMLMVGCMDWVYVLVGSSL